MDDLLWLDQIQPPHHRLVGEKAFYLSRLQQKGYPIMPGFVIPSSALHEFLETIHWLNPLFADLPNSSLHLDVDNPRQLQQVAQRMRHEITKAALPPIWETTLFAAARELGAKAVILRSSLALPSQRTRNTSLITAGLLESRVCACTAEAIAADVKQVWAGLFRASSLLFWQRNGLQIQQLDLAILVQPIRNARASGRLQANSNLWEIQATWGLGMALVRGEVLPDYYRIEPKTSSVQVQQLGRKSIAYHLVDSPLAQPSQSYLDTYLLNEEEQKQYALEAKSLAALIELTHRLTKELGSAFLQEWTFSQIEQSLEPQLYLTQAYPLLPTSIGSQSEERLHRGDADRENFLSEAPQLFQTAFESQIPTLKGLGASSGRATAIAQAIVGPIEHIEVPPGRIVIAHNIPPDWLMLLKRAAGIVTERGGMTSHSAIIARELGIPAIVGATDATKLIQTGEMVMVDGDRGELYRVTLESHFPSPSSHISFPAGRMGSGAYPERIATELLVNLSQFESLDKAIALPVDGVGLLRAELMILAVLEGQHPLLWLQQGRRTELIERLSRQISAIAAAFAPRPVFYRSMDLRSHEFQTLAGSNFSPLEVNPMLGLRGTFSYVSNPDLFDLELAALTEVYRTEHTNVNLILPFVRTVEEFSFCRRRVEQVGLTQYSQFELWIMAEVPSILLLLPDYVKAGVQGISIGTNDLTQLLLGVDREGERMAAAFDERHPAVMRAIQQLIQTARQLGIPCSICGQAPAQYPELIDSLVLWGISSISVSLDAVERTYVAIDRAERRLLLEAARRQLS